MNTFRRLFEQFSTCLAGFLTFCTFAWVLGVLLRLTLHIPAPASRLGTAFPNMAVGLTASLLLTVILAFLAFFCLVWFSPRTKCH